MRESADAFESRPSSTSKRARRAIIVGGKQRHPSRKRRVGPPTSDTTAGAQRLARFPTCLPRGTAGVDVTPTRIQTSRSDVQQPAATPNPQPARLALFSGLLVHYFGTPVSSSWCTLVVLPGFIQYSWFVSPLGCAVDDSGNPSLARFSALRRLRHRTPAPPSVGCRCSHRQFYPPLSLPLA